MDDTSNIADSLPWEEVKNLFKGNLPKNFNPETFKFATDEGNKQAVIESAWKSLKKTNPEATYEQASSLADMMQIFARMVVEQTDLRK